jgi:hypothetical protein
MIRALRDPDGANLERLWWAGVHGWSGAIA